MVIRRHCWAKLQFGHHLEWGPFTNVHFLLDAKCSSTNTLVSVSQELGLALNQLARQMSPKNVLFSPGFLAVFHNFNVLLEAIKTWHDLLWQKWGPAPKRNAPNPAWICIAGSHYQLINLPGQLCVIWLRFCLEENFLRQGVKNIQPAMLAVTGVVQYDHACSQFTPQKCNCV